MNIRPATVDDASALARVHVDSWRAAYRGLVPESRLQGFDYHWRTERFRQSLATEAEETYVALVDEQIVGFLTIGAARDWDVDRQRTGEIWGIYLAPTHWRQGIGRQLADEAETMLRSRGYQDIILWVLEGNHAARRFYEALGFRLDGESKLVDLGAPLKAVRYRKTISKEE